MKHKMLQLFGLEKFPKNLPKSFKFEIVKDFDISEL